VPDVGIDADLSDEHEAVVFGAAVAALNFLRRDPEWVATEDNMPGWKKYAPLATLYNKGGLDAVNATAAWAVEYLLTADRRNHAAWVASQPTGGGKWQRAWRTIEANLTYVEGPRFVASKRVLTRMFVHLGVSADERNANNFVRRGIADGSIKVAGATPPHPRPHTPAAAQPAASASGGWLPPRIFIVDYHRMDHGREDADRVLTLEDLQSWSSVPALWVGVKNEPEPPAFTPDWDLIAVFDGYVQGGYLLGKHERMSEEAHKREQDAEVRRARVVRPAAEAARGAGTATSPVILDVANKAGGWYLNRRARQDASGAAKAIMSTPVESRVERLTEIYRAPVTPGGWFFAYAELDRINAMRLVNKGFRLWLDGALAEQASRSGLPGHRR
jgi:hypothetical protein